MKKLKNILAVVLLAAATFSCNDVLDKGPLDSYSENDVWKSTDLTQAFLYTTLRISTDKLIQNDRWTDNDIILDDGEATAINKDLKDRYYDAGNGWFRVMFSCKAGFTVRTYSGNLNDS